MRTTRGKRSGDGGCEPRYGEVRSEESTRARCRTLDISLRFARRVESSLVSDSSSGTGAHQAYSSENVPVVVIEVTSSMTWQEDVTRSEKILLERAFRCR